MPALPLLLGAFLTSQSIVSKASELSSVSLAVFFLVAASADFAALSESSFLTDFFFGFAGEFLFGEGFGAALGVGRGAGFGVGLGVTVGVTVGSTISLFTGATGSFSIFSGGLLAAGVGSGDDSDFS